MAEAHKLATEGRANAGTGAARALRREGRVPSIVYGDDKEVIHLSVSRKDLEKELSTPGFFSRVVELNIDGKAQKALPKDVQFHPITDVPMHIDFIRVSRKNKVHVNVGFDFLNEDKCPGLKQGGVLNHVMHDIELSCYADQIPEILTIDLEGLEVGDSISADVLKLEDGVEFLHADLDSIIATIVPPTVAKADDSEAAEGEEGEAAEGAAASE